MDLDEIWELLVKKGGFWEMLELPFARQTCQKYRSAQSVLAHFGKSEQVHFCQNGPKQLERTCIFGRSGELGGKIGR